MNESLLFYMVAHQKAGDSPCGVGVSQFHERKAERTAYYMRFVYRWKQRKCSACNGSGYYDHNGSPQCGACDGTGKERYKSEVGTALDKELRGD